MSDIVNSKVATNFKKVLMNFEPEFLDRIEEYRRTQERIPSRADAIRELIEAGLLHKTKKPAHGTKPHKPDRG